MPRPSTTPKSARIRPALASDLDALVGVVASVLREHGLVSRLESVEHDLRDLDARFGGEHTGLWVAEVDGTLVGCVAIRPKEGLTCELTHLYLSPETRGLGLGQALYQQAEAFARQAGFARVWLESSRGFGAARGLYERNGFMQLEELDDALSDDVYEKQLVPLEPEAGPPVLETGRRFRGLLVQSLIAKGAMGATYLASHPVLRTPFAIKTWRRQGTATPFHEAHLAARVTSQHVVAVTDAGVEQDIPFVIQRYVDGIDLGELTSRLAHAGRRLPVSVVCRLVIDAARGLHALHQAGVVHRDVKPENLFLCGSGQVIVGDLGFALDPTAAVFQDEISGTPFFMAPEQWMGTDLDRKADIYALGATAHAIATCQPPFLGSDVRALREAHIGTVYAAPAVTDPREAYFFSCVARMLQKDRRERFPNADAVARALEVVSEEPSSYVQIGEDAARVGQVLVTLAVGDLAACEADVLVCAANWKLTMHVGVAAALANAAGPSLPSEAARFAPAAMGDVVWTSAGELGSRYVAHAVAALAGSVCIQRCTLRVLLEAEARHVRTVAMPALGSGVGEVPVDLSAKLILDAIRTYADFAPEHARSVKIVLHDEAKRARWREILCSMG